MLLAWQVSSRASSSNLPILRKILKGCESPAPKWDKVRHSEGHSRTISCFMGSVSSCQLRLKLQPGHTQIPESTAHAKMAITQFAQAHVAHVAHLAHVAHVAQVAHDSFSFMIHSLFSCLAESKESKDKDGLDGVKDGDDAQAGPEICRRKAMPRPDMFPSDPSVKSPKLSKLSKSSCYLASFMVRLDS